jgi:hypothetical protein
LEQTQYLPYIPMMKDRENNWNRIWYGKKYVMI